jgi:hypothetical protein
VIDFRLQNNIGVSALKLEVMFNYQFLNYILISASKTMLEFQL